MAEHQNPLKSLQIGRWVKLICGASYQDMPTIRRLAMLYTLAGVDCIDVAADVAVIAAAQRGMQDAPQVAAHLASRGYCFPVSKPWLMVSLNDSEDPHFRKAYFDANRCPPTCDRPCERACPTAAIQFQGPTQGGVLRDLCYGCGRCLTICPFNHIEAHFHQADLQALVHSEQIDAIEIHTHIGQQAAFAQLWHKVLASQSQLQAISISCPDGPGLGNYLRDLYEIMMPLSTPLIWQTDGRPMSGDLGRGTTQAAIQLAQKVLQLNLPGYIQLAGGTNPYTVDKLAELNLVGPEVAESSSVAQNFSGTGGYKAPIAGIAYGSYARKLLMPQLHAMEKAGYADLDHPDGFSSASPWEPASTLAVSPLIKAAEEAQRLVGKLKHIPIGSRG